MTEPSADHTPEELARIELLLAERRPVPARAFRGDLGRSVAVEVRRRRITARPEHLWARAGLLCAAGAALLAAAAAQL